MSKLIKFNFNFSAKKKKKNWQAYMCFGMTEFPEFVAVLVKCCSKLLRELVMDREA